MNQPKEGSLTRARAKISWGHDPAKVKSEALADGVDEATADATIQDALARRNRHFRTRGMIDLVFAAIAVAAIVWFMLGYLEHQRDAINRPPVATVSLLGAYACFRLFKGLSRVVFGGMGERAESDRGLTFWDFFLGWFPTTARR
jgi:hypothetical protein